MYIHQSIKYKQSINTQKLTPDAFAVLFSLQLWLQHASMWLEYAWFLALCFEVCKKLKPPLVANLLSARINALPVDDTVLSVVKSNYSKKNEMYYQASSFCKSMKLTETTLSKQSFFTSQILF